MTDHQWVLIDHLGSLLGLLTAIVGFLIWAAKWGKHIFRRWLTEAVTAAVRSELQPLAEKVDEIHPWYLEVSKYVKPRANGKAFGVAAE